LDSPRVFKQLVTEDFPEPAIPTTRVTRGRSSALADIDNVGGTPTAEYRLKLVPIVYVT
jgi:hypothetical protein